MEKILPKGWLKEFLSRQMTGITGHIEQCGYPFDREWWGTDNCSGFSGTNEIENSDWWTYEQTAYWLDGFVRCAVLLRDEQSIAKVEKIVYKVIEGADSDGYLGPAFLKQTDGWHRWPHVVFFRACMALYEYTRDERIVNAIKRHYVESPCDYSLLRDVNNVEIMLWCYGITKDERLLALAEKSYSDYNEKCKNDVCDRIALSDKKPYAHGVTYCEYSKLGALLYKYTKKETYLIASKSAFDKAEKTFMLPSGCLCSDEFLISNHYTESYETCVITDYTYALYALADATNDTHYLDLIERCIFNSGLGSVTEDFKALQYFSCANQLIADKSSNHNLFFKGSKWMSYRPNPSTECCPGNVNRFMPNYLLNTWEQVGDTVICRLYGASVYKNEDTEVTETTNYPFEDTVSFSICTKRAFVLKLRIPKWVKSYRITCNGNAVLKTEENGYAIVDVAGNCALTLEFENAIERVTTYDGVYFRRGALVYSLGGSERREIDSEEPRSSREFPAYNMYPDFEWRYAVADNSVAEYTVGNGTYYDGISHLPFIGVNGRYVRNWDYERKKAIKRCTNLYENVIVEETGDFSFTPKLPEKVECTGETVRLKLYPYGGCKLRLTVFPILK